MNRIYCIGMGPGDPSYLTPLARRKLEELSVVFGAPRLLELVPQGPATFTVEGSVAGSLDRISEAVERSDVGVVVSGDPGFYSLGRALRRRFGRKNVISIPGISSLQILASRIGCSWANVPCLSLHGREGNVISEFPPDDFVVLLGKASEVPEQILSLSRSGLDSRLAWLGWDLGLKGERLFSGSLSQLAHEGIHGKLALLWIEGGDGE
jgi:precorrin-6y C5,15-methyltransferase (decarboxylating) CbiE subunit